MEEKIRVVGLPAIPTMRIARLRLPPIEKRVTLNKLTFDLIPPELPQPQVKENDELNYQTAADIFRRTYKLIYHNWPDVSMSLGKEWETAVKNARSAGMDFQSFLAFNMAGYKLTHPHTPFYRSIITAKSSVDKIQEIKKLCLDKFNAVDAERMGMMLDIILDNVDEAMLASEVAFGTWIVGQKLRIGGNTTQDFYERKEIGLSQFWLAVEPTYYDCVLTSYIKQKFGSEAEQKHRHLVLQTIGKLKRRPTLASTVFNSRCRIMQAAVKHVLGLYGLTQESFTYPDEPVYECYSFWNSLGLALLHFETTKAVLGDRHRLWR